MLNSSGIGTYLRNLLPLVISELDEILFYLLGKRNELIDTGITEFNNVDCIEYNQPIYSIKEQIAYTRMIPNETKLFWASNSNKSP